MKPTFDFSPLCQSFFSKRLMGQSKASPHTISAYAQMFRLLMAYAQKRLHLPPSKLSLAQLDATFIAEFLDDLESGRSNGTRTRNARLASLRSFYHYAALEARFVITLLVDPCFQHSHCWFGQWGASLFSSFTFATDVCTGTQRHVSLPQPSNLGEPQPCLYS